MSTVLTLACLTEYTFLFLTRFDSISILFTKIAINKCKPVFTTCYRIYGTYNLSTASLKGEKPAMNMANNRIPSGPNTPGSQQTPTHQGIKVFIQRDYSEGTAVKFQTRFPAELEDRIDRQTFEYTMERLNEHFEMAETADCSTYCEGCLACITAYFIYICTETHYEKHLRKVSKFISTQNERIYNPRGIHITDPILRGLRVIEITIIDPPNGQSPTGNNAQLRHT